MKAQMDCAGYFIDVLAARTLSADCSQFDFGFRDVDRGQVHSPRLSLIRMCAGDASKTP